MKYIFAVILTVLLLTACGGNAGTIKIGFVAPLSGDASVYGDPLHKGALLAIEEINAAGGVNGKMLELISEDGLCKGETAAKAGNKLITVNKVQVILGGLCSSETLAIAPMAEEAKVVLFSAASSNPSITDAGDFVFRSTPSDQLQGGAMAEHLIDVNIKTAAVIYANSDYNLGLKNAFQKRFEELGGKVAIAETYEQDSKDFRTQLTKIKASNAGALYVIPYAEGGLILKQAKELGLSMPYFGSETMGDKKIIDEAAGAGEGFVYATPKFNAENPKSKEYLAKFKAKHGAEPGFPSFTANAYDNIYLIADAIRAKGETGEGIRDYLYTVKDYDGVGGMLTIDSNGDALKEFQLMMVKNGELVPYAKEMKEEPKPAPKPAPKPEPKIDASTVETVEAPAPVKPKEEMQRIIVSMKEWDIQPGESYVKPGKIQLQIVNRGSNPHGLEIRDANKNTIAKGEVVDKGGSSTLEFTALAGVYEIREQDELGWQKGIRGLIVVE